MVVEQTIATVTAANRIDHAGTLASCLRGVSTVGLRSRSLEERDQNELSFRELNIHSIPVPCQ